MLRPRRAQPEEAQGRLRKAKPFAEITSGVIIKGQKNKGLRSVITTVRPYL